MGVEVGVELLDGYVPGDFGLDATVFPGYRCDPVTGRQVQLEVVEFAAYCEKRFACVSAPVGIGKMLIAITLAKLTGMRTGIVAPYKGLEGQYLSELRGHVTGIRGRANYTCGDYAQLDCRGGLSMGCRYAGGNGCEYEREVWKAREADVVVTNYDYWLNKHAHGGGLQRGKEEAERLGENPIELLILDEGDMASEKLSEFLACRVYENEVKRYADPRGLGDKVGDWKKHVTSWLPRVDAEIAEALEGLGKKGRNATGKQVEAVHALQRLKDKFERIGGAQSDDWVLEERVGTKWGRMWAFDVVWPGRYAEQYLYRGVPKIVVMAGTLVRQDLGLMGIGKDVSEYRQWASIFPVSKQPTYVLPPRKQTSDGWVNINVDSKTRDEDLQVWIETIDSIIESRLDRKILIGTTSYEWQRRVMSMSRYADLMVGNTNDPDSDSAQQVFEDFCGMDAPRILVSPSFARGWNFAFERAEVAILSKCPFVPMQSKVMKARLKKDKGYGDLLCMKKIEQFNGRIKRDPKDQGETFLVDGHFVYFLRRAERLAQDWFVRSVRRVVELPRTPRKLDRKNND